MKPIYVICFYWQGERWREEGMEYDKVGDLSFKKHLQRVGEVTHELANKYVNNLYKGVKKWAVHPFKFICFTNDEMDFDEGVDPRPFTRVTKKGVLPRMWMYSEEAGLFGHQVLCLDIDVVIAGSLRDIMNYDGLYCVRTTFAGPQRGMLDGDIQSFRAGKETEEIFWNPFIKNVEEAERVTKGRERFWVRKVMSKDKADIWNEVAPNQVLSYKRHIRGRTELPENARIISCHGYPRPHQIEEKWRTENWK